MISAKKLINLAREWLKHAAIRRKRITFPLSEHGNSCNSEKGHFVVYSNDQSQFVLPLAYLNREIVQKLFALAEDEFGLPSKGPVTLPCDATFMEYVITSIRQNVAIEVEKALLPSIVNNSPCISSLYSYSGVTNQQLPICSF